VSDFQVVLLGNYAPTLQQSMLRFAELLLAGWRRRGVPAFLVQPEPWAASVAPAPLRKWAVYVDQYMRFPTRSTRLAVEAGWDPEQPTVFHICDHGNSPYLRALRGRSVVVTCHDLLAVRAARGEATYCPVSPTGRILQAWILSQLKKIPWVACDSNSTRMDFLRLTGREGDPQVETIPLALNAPFAPVPRADIITRLARYPGLLDSPYLLHVGSTEPRKNRIGVLRTLALARPHWPGGAVFAGEPLNETERAAARELGLPDPAVREVPRPTHDELAALYSGAHALVYPSHAEGYGWPVLEAQACGCPVVCSNTTSLPEVAGAGAVLRAPEDYQGLADAVLALAEPAARSALITAGHANVARFTEEKMLDAYALLYQRALETHLN
jgi:glycosyltransferase involved in cell wall biosynthesis